MWVPTGSATWAAPTRLAGLTQTAGSRSTPWAGRRVPGGVSQARPVRCCSEREVGVVDGSQSTAAQVTGEGAEGGVPGKGSEQVWGP